MGFEGAGYLPAGAGEVYGADVFGFGHDGDGRGVRGQSSLGFFLRVSKCVAMKWEERTVTSTVETGGRSICPRYLTVGRQVE